MNTLVTLGAAVLAAVVLALLIWGLARATRKMAVRRGSILPAIMGVRSGAGEGLRLWRTSEAEGLRLIRESVERAAGAIADAVVEKKITHTEATRHAEAASRALKDAIEESVRAGRVTPSEAEKVIAAIRESGPRRS